MSIGKVYLVGAGPGDPGLLTLRGQQCLRQADVVLYDGLVNPLLLRHTQATAERTARVAGPFGRSLDQADINRRLIEAARQGQTVVRLKGGDPFIFGRGAEEAAALAQAGIPFEIVPGVTAATAAGGYAGIPLTHRDHASAVALITGHEDPSKDDMALDYAALARFPGTLVFYMGLHRLPFIAESLIASGLAASTPAAAVSRASTPRQQTLVGTLATLPEQVRSVGLRPPSLIVVGNCVTLRDSIRWFESRPLFGLRIGITRPEQQADEQIRQVLDLGAEPVLMPTICIAPPDDESRIADALEHLNEFDWLIFTSVNGVQSLLSRLWDSGRDFRTLSHVKIAAIGSSTADELAKYHLRADLMPSEFRGEALAAALAPHVSGRRILWPRANRGRDVLPTALRAAGAVVEELVVYRNDDVDSFSDEVMAQLDAGDIDWVGLSSPSIARQFAALLTETARQHVGTRIKLAAISPVTAEAATEAGLLVTTVATTYTWAGIFAAIQAAR